MKDICININEYVKVKLTTQGLETLVNHYSDVSKGDQNLLTQCIIRHKKDEFYHFLFWELLNIFGGKNMSIGQNSLFEQGMYYAINE